MGIGCALVGLLVALLVAFVFLGTYGPGVRALLVLVPVAALFCVWLGRKMKVVRDRKPAIAEMEGSYHEWLAEHPNSYAQTENPQRLTVSLLMLFAVVISYAVVAWLVSLLDRYFYRPEIVPLLPTALVLLTLDWLWLGWQANIVRKQKAALAEIKSAGGSYEILWGIGDRPIESINWPDAIEPSRRSKLERLFPEARLAKLAAKG